MNIQKSAVRMIVSTLLICLLASFWPLGAVPVSAARTFNHPGMLHTEESFAAMQENIEEGVQPNLDTWNALLNNGFSAPDWQPRETQTVIRGGDGSNYAAFHIDIRRAYQTALIWKLSGSESHGEAACRILNAWSGTMAGLAGNADRFLAAGIYGYELANTAEIMRDHPSFDEEAMEELLLNVFYPMTDDFLANHNGAHFGNYWANWDLCNIASMMAIGIFTDRVDIYEQALSYYKDGIGMGSLYNAMPYVYEEGLAQWQESGRDQGHTTLGISLCGAVCEMAWNQGDDLYSLSDNRFLKAAEYVAKYNNNEEVPYNTYERYAGQTGRSEFGEVLGDSGRGMMRPVYSLVYNHYVARMGMGAPNIEKVLHTEDGYRLELECSNGDEFGWQTLTFANTGERSAAKTARGILEDGVYRIRSRYTGKSLVVDEEGTLMSARRGTQAAEWWRFESTGDGEYIITNTATGQVLQTEGSLYANDSAYSAGSRKDALNQRFAVLKNDSGDYRILSSVNGFAVSLRGEQWADDTPVVQWKYFNGRAQNWFIETRREAAQADIDKKAMFTFDDEEGGFECAAAIANGNYTLEDSYNERNGKALYLDGSSEQYLTITDWGGASFLAGAEELTISFETKVDRADTNWVFYAAPDENMQVNSKEKYIGILLKDGVVTAERYNNNGKRPVCPSAEVGADWVRVDVVMDGAAIELFVDGKKCASYASGYSITDILGEEGILQIGKANWGADGEFYKGWIDNLTIRTIALDAETIANNARYFVSEKYGTPLILPYEDVKKDSWYYDSVEYAYFEGLMTGKSDTVFSPEETLVRGQFASVLHRMESEPVIIFTPQFPDVTAEDWYAGAVLWAKGAGVVNGYHSGCFGAGDNIVREQMAVMMYNYAVYKGYDVSAMANLSRFSDAGEVSDYAVKAIRWAVGAGIINGKNGGTKLDPFGETSRAECAAIIMNYMEIYK